MDFTLTAEQAALVTAIEGLAARFQQTPTEFRGFALVSERARAGADSGGVLRHRHDTGPRPGRCGVGGGASRAPAVRRRGRAVDAGAPAGCPAGSGRVRLRSSNRAVPVGSSRARGRCSSQTARARRRARLARCSRAGRLDLRLPDGAAEAPVATRPLGERSGRRAQVAAGGARGGSRGADAGGDRRDRRAPERAQAIRQTARQLSGAAPSHGGVRGARGGREVARAEGGVHGRRRATPRWLRFTRRRARLGSSTTCTRCSARWG